MVLKGKKDSCDFVELYSSQNHRYNERLELNTKSKKNEDKTVVKLEVIPKGALQILQ